MQTSTVQESIAPQSLEAERAVLGSIILDNGALHVAGALVNQDDFFSAAHRAIFQELNELIGNNRTADLVTLSEEIGKEGLLEKIGGSPYLAALVDGVPVGNYALVQEYARIVKEKSLLRRLINSSNNVISRCYQGSEDPEVLLDLAQAEIFEIAGERVSSGFVSLREVIPPVFQRISELAETKQPVTGIETGIERLDELTSGLQPGELVILAARPSLGKTALALNIGAHAAITKNKSIGIFSLEMSKESLVTRLLCSEARIDSHKLRTGFLSRDEWQKMTNALGRMAEAPIYIDDAAGLSILQIRAKSRQLKMEKKGLDLLIVDYLQLATGHGKFENRNQEVSFISRGLKGIAKELGIPVLALSQLSRSSEQRGNERPQLHHLRESGSIEQDADVVIFIHRDRSATPESGEETEPPGIRVKLIIGKQRNGPTGDVDVLFLKPFVRFENIAPDAYGGDE